MKPSDKPRFALIMAGMADNFRDSITKDGMTMRFEMLKEFTIEGIERAARKIMATRKYTKMPPIAEFLEHLNPTPQIKDQALIAATKIVSHLKRHGARVFPGLDDDPISKYLMTDRWPYYQWGTTITESETKWWVKEFCEAYRVYESTGEVLKIGNGPDRKRIENVTSGMLQNIG